MRTRIQLRADAAGRLDRALADQLGLGRAAVKRAFALGEVRVRGRRARASDAAEPGAEVELEVEGPAGPPAPQPDARAAGAGRVGAARWWWTSRRGWPSTRWRPASWGRWPTRWWRATRSAPRPLPRRARAARCTGSTWRPAAAWPSPGTGRPGSSSTPRLGERAGGEALPRAGGGPPRRRRGLLGPARPAGRPRGAGAGRRWRWIGWRARASGPGRPRRTTRSSAASAITPCSRCAWSPGSCTRSGPTSPTWATRWRATRSTAGRPRRCPGSGPPLPARLAALARGARARGPRRREPAAAGAGAGAGGAGARGRVSTATAAPTSWAGRSSCRWCSRRPSGPRRAPGTPGRTCTSSSALKKSGFDGRPS